MKRLALALLVFLPACGDDEPERPGSDQPAPPLDAPVSVAPATPGPAARLRFLMGTNDRLLLEIQARTAPPADLAGVRGRVLGVRSHVAELETLSPYSSRESNELLAVLARVAEEGLSDLGQADWAGEGAASAFARLAAVCHGCHIGAPSLEDRPSWEAGLRGRLDAPSRDACGACHAEVLAEWSRTLHAAAWTEPVYRMSAGDPPKTECRSCHAPLAVLATGFSVEREWRPHLRAANHDDGVGCASCHQRADGTVAATRDVPGAPCRPVRDDRLASPEFCGSCHNPTHLAYDEWRASAAAARGEDCLDCHARSVERTLADGTKRAGVAHDFPGGGDPALVARALSWSARLEHRELVVHLENLAAHKFPGEVPTRSLRIEVRALSREGATVFDEVVALKRPAKGQVGVPDTRLLPDESREVRVALPAGAREVELEILFQTSPLARREAWFSLGTWKAQIPPD